MRDFLSTTLCLAVLAACSSPPPEPATAFSTEATVEEQAQVAAGSPEKSPEELPAAREPQAMDEPAQPAPPPAPQDFESWRHEHLTFPPAWGPTLPAGKDHVVFSPGMFREGHDEFWSYGYVADLETAGFADAASMDTYFEAFYDGLLGAVSGGALGDDPATAVVTQLGDGLFEAKIDLIDAFVTKDKIRVTALARAEQLDAQHTRLTVRISPQPKDHPVWQRLAGATAAITNP